MTRYIQYSTGENLTLLDTKGVTTFFRGVSDIVATWVRVSTEVRELRNRQPWSTLLQISYIMYR